MDAGNSSIAFKTMLAVLVLTLAGCFAVEAPGEGARADEGRLRGDEIAQAIERFRKEHERLPESMSELVPRYLAELPPDCRKGAEGVSFCYRLVEKSDFELEFTYYGPGINSCRRRTNSYWICSGHL